MQMPDAPYLFICVGEKSHLFCLTVLLHCSLEERQSVQGLGVCSVIWGLPFVRHDMGIHLNYYGNSSLNLCTVEPLDSEVGNSCVDHRFHPTGIGLKFGNTQKLPTPALGTCYL